MKTFKPFNRNSYFSVWGDFTFDSDKMGFILIGYQDNAGTVFATETLAIKAFVGDTELVIFAKAGEPIPAVIDGVGRITKLKDVGSRVRAVYI